MMRSARLIRLYVLLFLCCVCFFPPSAQAFTLIGEQQEIEMGRNMAKEAEKQFGLVNDPELQARVQRIGLSLAKASDRPGLPYTFKVLNSKEINAFACPGGYVFVFKGLVDAMPSDEELAGVIGHEVGHIVKRHAIRQLEKSLGMTLLLALLTRGQGLELQGVAIEAIMAGYSRADEREADYLGFVHTYKAGYNPYSMMMSMRKLAEMNQTYHNDLFSDHPESQARVNSIQNYLNDYKIRPKIIELPNGSVRVVDGEWKLPPLYGAYQGYKTFNRACLLAGNLYRLTQRKDYSPDCYILDSDGHSVTVYYNEQVVITLTEADAAPQNMSLMELAGVYLEKLKEWK